eukprot:4453602-Pyramimonas_sp.AAC.1
MYPVDCGGRGGDAQGGQDRVPVPAGGELLRSDRAAGPLGARTGELQTAAAHHLASGAAT